MSCCTPASRFSNVIVVGTGSSRIVEVSNAMFWATTVTAAPRPPGPVPAGPPGPTGPARRGLHLAGHRRVDLAVEEVGTRLERVDLVVGLSDTRDQRPAEQRGPRELRIVEDLDVVLGVRVLVVEPKRERLACRDRQRGGLERDVRRRERHHLPLSAPAPLPL